jgi:hypothetical protein
MTGSWVLKGMAVVFAFAALSVAGCGDDDDGGTKPQDNLSEIDVPLTVGNQWSYSVASTVGGDTDTYPREDEVTGTVQFEGQTYAVLQAILDSPGARLTQGLKQLPFLGAAPQADTSETYLRQSGQKIFVTIDFDTSGVGNEVQRFLYDTLNESMPWEFVDLAAAQGSSKTLVEAERTFEVRGGTGEVDLNITARNEGRVSVTVPKGTYGDVCKARIVQTIHFRQNIPPLPPITQTILFTQDLYLKDGIGIVKETAESSFQQTGSDPEVATDEATLTDFTLER